MNVPLEMVEAVVEEGKVTTWSFEGTLRRVGEDIL